MIVTAKYKDRSYPINAISGDHITRQIEASGTFYEADLLKEIASRSLCGVYIDVGAHIGNHSVFFANECSSTQVIAFEPNPAVWPALKSNAKTFGFRPIACAIHESWDKANLVTIDPNNLGMSKIEEGDHVPCIRLDDFRPGTGPICLIKVDVEGCELAVLKSAASIIFRSRPTIVCEAHNEQKLAELDKFLTNYVRSPGVYAYTPTYIWHPSA